MDNRARKVSASHVVVIAAHRTASFAETIHRAVQGKRRHAFLGGSFSPHFRCGPPLGGLRLFRSVLGFEAARLDGMAGAMLTAFVSRIGHDFRRRCLRRLCLFGLSELPTGYAIHEVASPVDNSSVVYFWKIG